MVPKRQEPIIHEFQDAKTKLIESIKITGSPEYGIATIHDRDLLIFAVSQLTEARQAGRPISRKVRFTPYQYFNWLGIAAAGSAYGRLGDTLDRLKGTDIQTTLRSPKHGKKRRRVRNFSWISESDYIEVDGEIRGIEIVLAEWLLESVEEFQVLTFDRLYFEIPGAMERWLYLHARKCTGGPSGMWREGFKSLYAKSASLQQYKHFASSLRKIVVKDSLPGFRLELVRSAEGKDMLKMIRLRKGEADQKTLEYEYERAEELSSLEEAWQHVLDLLRKSIGKATVRVWLEKIDVGPLEKGELDLFAPTQFIASEIEAKFLPKIKQAWHELGFPVEQIAFSVRN